MYDEVVKKIADIGVQKDKPKEGDYTDEEGLLVCGICHTRKRKKVMLIDRLTMVAVPCKCEQEAREKEKELADKQKKYDKAMELARSSLIADKFKDATFDTCTVVKGNARQLRICKRYAENFEELYRKNQGLLLYGDCSTGKSHAAACICNHLMKELHPVYATSFVKLLDDKSNVDVQSVIDMMNKVELVLFDDLGAERDTPYAQEVVYNLIDGRYRQNKPMIITTNLSLKYMQTVEDVRFKRIYQRVLEYCYPVCFDGPSFRMQEAARRYDEMEKLLGG